LVMTKILGESAKTGNTTIAEMEKNLGHHGAQATLLDAFSTWLYSGCHFFRNGTEIGVAFYNLSTKDWLRPAISLSYDSKVTINFGPTFKNKPSSCTGL